MAPSIDQGFAARTSYTRRIVREDVAAHLNRVREMIGFENIPEWKNFISSQSGDQPMTEDKLPHRPKSTNQELPADTKVCIVGAGMAGLYAALILDELEIPYDILEASDRPGGRILTHYFSTKPNDYYDIGAMRFPFVPVMKRTFDLFARTGIETREYYLSGPGTPKRYNAVTKFSEVKKVDPKPTFDDPFGISVSNGGSVPDEYVFLDTTLKAIDESTRRMDKIDSILADALEPYREAVKKGDDEAYQMLLDVDELTVRDFLRDRKKLDYHTIQWLEKSDSATGLFDQAFTEAVLDSVAFDYYSDADEEWYCIKGGSTKLTEALLAKLKTRPLYNKRVTKYALDRTREDDKKMMVVCNYDEEPRYYNTVFNTTTLACLQRVDTTDLELTTTARDALRVLHYDSSTKVAIKFTNAWWKTKCGITKGGVANTDLPIRVCVYPSYDQEKEPGTEHVLLATYTWAQDATRIGSLVNLDSPRGEEELKGLMLYNLARLHSTDEASFNEMYQLIKDSYITHHGFDWAMDDYSSGAFALFGPGQFRYLYPHLIRPAADARFHILGEAASANHAWVVGSLESAYRGIWLFLERFRCFDLQKKMVDSFGTVPELDTGESGYAHLLVALGLLQPGARRKTQDQRAVKQDGSKVAA